MASSQDFSTPQWTAEERAWLCIYLYRIGRGKPLTEGFNKQFRTRDHTDVQKHASIVHRCEDKIHLQLATLARQFPWYTDPPQDEEKGYKTMMRLKKQAEARSRKEQKDLEREADLTEKDVGADVAERDVSPPSSPRRTTAGGLMDGVDLDSLNNPVSISSSSSTLSHTDSLNDEDPIHSNSGSQVAEAARQD